MNEYRSIRPLSARLGFWSALLGAATFAIFTLCFVIIATSGPLFRWTNLPDYLDTVNRSSQLFKHVAQLCMLLFAPLFVVLVNSVHDYASGEQKALTRIATHLATGFAVLVGLHYFVQLGPVRFSIRSGEVEGLAPFLQANPISVILGVNMLGWTLFFGLSSLFLAPVFSAGGVERVIRISFLVNGICCLGAGLSYLLQIEFLLFLLINLGMGGAVTVMTISLAVLFGRIARNLGPATG